MVTVPGLRECVVAFSERRNSIASRFSRPPLRLGTKSAAAAEIQVQHRGDRIDAQAVEMELLEPVAGAREQEAAHFVALVVEDQRAPVACSPLRGSCVFVQRGAIEARQAVGVAREMSRHPVEQHADAGLMALIDEIAQVVGRAVAAGGREVAGGLVAPGVIERMLGDRQQLDVREALRAARRESARRPARGSCRSGRRRAGCQEPACTS